MFLGQSEVGEIALNSNGDANLTYADINGDNITKPSGVDGPLVTLFSSGSSYDRQLDTALMRPGTPANYDHG